MRAVLHSKRWIFAILVVGQVLAAEEIVVLRREVPFRDLESLSYYKSGDPLVDWGSRRVWTSTEGTKIQAKILGVNADTVILELENGKNTAIPLERFVAEDRRFIREWKAVSVYFNLGYEATKNIGNTIEAGILDGAFAQAGKVHETRNFRFECDAPLTQEVVKDFSRLFEVTYLGVLANPLRLALAKPEGGKFQVRLFASEVDYVQAGGSRDAAGMYRVKDRVMLVPLSSLGLTLGSTGYKKTREFDPRTLIHETTHALTHQWLNFAPMWFIEGFADYVAAIPYKDGSLDLSKHREGLLAMAGNKFGGDPARFPLVHPADLITLGPRLFMGEPELVEGPTLLPRVEPFQIALASNAKTPKTAEPRIGNKKAEFEVATPAIPVGPGSPLVVQRYISSMALVHSLISTGRTAEFRQYLFDFLHFDWELNAYLTQFEKTHKIHHAAVEAQIKEFETKLKRYNAAVDTYNEEVIRYNNRELRTPPPLPEEPIAPPPLPVPEILARPRTPEALSRMWFLQEAWDRHLHFDGKLTLDLLP